MYILPPEDKDFFTADFNAHIAEVGCNPVSNSQGLALRDLVERNNLFVAPLDKGPGYT